MRFFGFWPISRKSLPRITSRSFNCESLFQRNFQTLNREGLLFGNFSQSWFGLSLGLRDVTVETLLALRNYTLHTLNAFWRILYGKKSFEKKKNREILGIVTSANGQLYEINFKVVVFLHFFDYFYSRSRTKEVEGKIYELVYIQTVWKKTVEKK